MVLKILPIDLHQPFSDDTRRNNGKQASAPMPHSSAPAIAVRTNAHCFVGSNYMNLRRSPLGTPLDEGSF